MSAVRGISQYQQAGFTGFANSAKSTGYASASGGDFARSSASSSGSSGDMTATVVTKTVGFRLGKFGISYASEELQVDSGSLEKAAPALTGSSLSDDGFSAEMDVAAVRDSLALAQSLDYSASAYGGASSDSIATEPTALTRRLGASAYARTQSAMRGRVDAPVMFQASV